MTGNPETFRHTDLSLAMLNHLIGKGYKKSEVIRAGIKLFYLLDDETQKNMLTEPEKMMIGKVDDGKIVFDWASEVDK